ncbi:deoxyribose-phosphate aldolase [Halpernia frigidisoli]|uniref:Deoxyribose-phosphate aldolase n=1 Tax=Halpernia frigidisoli TaxID=1125876 RepID=A0A1I3J1Z6_9FLAO|nr:deoxyribose-phosphate aldolase [Halpernia frigidisoli]SFI54311.1 deoxyribose-phosphate aldolase [Halpernia frigidisoli]
MQLEKYLDSTYLKTPEQAGISKEETLLILKNLTDEAIENQIFAVMIRPDFVNEIRTYLDEKNSKVRLGTVIGFPEGTFTEKEKLEEAEKAISDGADELDFVVNYEALKKGNLDLVESEFLNCTSLALKNKKIAKWIIEIATLNENQIAEICQKISTWAKENFKEDQLKNIFIKSSTGFYKTENDKPNGATFEGIKIMLENSNGLPVKAAGGVKTNEDAVKMINLGVTRIGTSSAKALLQNSKSEGIY